MRVRSSPSLTLMAWVRVDSLPLDHNSLLSMAPDKIGEILVGATLVILGTYVLGMLVLGKSVRPKTRITLFANGILWMYGKLERLFRSGPVREREVFRNGYGTRSSFVVGMIHGVGAETPTQLLIFLLAANLGGIRNGLLGLAMFVGGLVLMNAFICAAAAGVIRVGESRPLAMRVLMGVAAVYSLVLGATYLVKGGFGA